jgi:hypothetical protein
MPKTKERVSNAADSVKPYVERAVRDKEMRESLQNAYAAARDIYDELIAPRSPTAIAVRAATDKEIQDNFRTALDELRNAAGRMQGRESHSTRNATLIVTGIALGVLFNPMTGADTRRWLKDKLFGGSSDFDYSSSSPAGTTGNNSSGS